MGSIYASEAAPVNPTELIGWVLYLSLRLEPCNWARDYVSSLLA